MNQKSSKTRALFMMRDSVASWQKKNIREFRGCFFYRTACATLRMMRFSKKIKFVDLANG